MILMSVVKHDGLRSAGGGGVETTVDQNSDARVLYRKTAYSSRACLCLKPGVDCGRPQIHVEDYPAVPPPPAMRRYVDGVCAGSSSSFDDDALHSGKRPSAVTVEDDPDQL